MNDLTEVNWSPVLDEGDTSRAWDIFLILFNNIANKHAPFKKMRVPEVTQKWVTDDYISIAHDRDHFSDKFHKPGREIFKVQHRGF